jgi:anaerobic magnesium-protoporphyrin IX monomethyl ester cyclase
MIVLTHGYFLQDDEKEKAIMKPYPPLGILYLSAYMEEKGFEHDVFDTTFSSREKFNEYLLEKKPAILAVYINLMTKINVVKTIQFVRSQPSLQHTKIILGGPDVRYNKENLLHRGADFLVIGEGEETFYELVTALYSNQSCQSIAGISFKMEDGTIIINPERSLRKNLDELPMPNRKKIDLNAYLQTWKKHHGFSSVTVSTMRGCPYSCHWCSRGVYGKSYRRRSPESVVDEMKFIQQQYNPDNIWFVDDVFTVSHKWLEEFTLLVEQQKLKLNYECITRADRLNEEVIQLLKRSGCFRVWIGAESGSQKIIDLMDRRVDVKVVQQMINAAQKAGIQAGTFIMLGYPTETEQDIKQTLQHLKKSNPEWFTITITYPIRGTELFEEVEAVSNAHEINWAENTDRDIDFKRTYNKQYYHHAVQWIINEMAFYQRKNKQLGFVASAKAKTKSVRARIGMMMEKRKTAIA